MVERIMIDAGVGGWRNCAGGIETSPPGHAHLIGRTLAVELEKYGYEVLFSGDVPQLNDHGGAGRPSACASVARAWEADAVLRLCVRAAELPEVGTANALVFRRNTPAWALADSILCGVETGSRLHSQGTRASQRFLLLRRTPCPCVILVLGLPFRQKEFLFETEIKNYAECIAEGIHNWAMVTQNSN